jgi:hypothetical protein
LKKQTVAETQFDQHQATNQSINSPNQPKLHFACKWLVFLSLMIYFEKKRLFLSPLSRAADFGNRFSIEFKSAFHRKIKKA